MAKRQASARVQTGAQSSPFHEKKTPSTRKGKPLDVRRSARLKDLSQIEGRSGRQRSEIDASSAGEATWDRAVGCLSDFADHPLIMTTFQQPNTSSEPSLKRKRGQEAPHPSLPAQDPVRTNQARESTRHLAEGQSHESEKHIITTVAEPLKSWVLTKRWPSEYFEPDDQAQEELERDSWLEYIADLPPIPVVEYVEIDGFRYPKPIKKIPASLHRKQSDSSLAGASEQTGRTGKSSKYRSSQYATLLELKGSFLCDFDDDNLPTTVTKPGQDLLNAEQVVLLPQDSLFRDDIFRRFCRQIEGRNEAMVIQDVSRLLVPSAKNLAVYGDRRLDILIENVNEAWTQSIPVEGPRPQPDYSVGFRRSAFTDEQLQKLGPLIGSVFDTSFFVATFRMYFPFLTCEVKCGAAALDIADRQNAHSMTLAVRGVVELFRAVKREKELNQEILAFSISHDDRSVRIYGHYPVIDGDKVTFYRHLIRSFSFVEMDGREKWTTYKFIRNVYDVWMPTHLKRICSAIESLPAGIDFEVPEGSGVQSEDATGLSQDMGSLLSGPSDIGIASQMGQEGGELTPIAPPTATPDTSVSKEGGQGAAKKAKKNPRKNKWVAEQ